MDFNLELIHVYFLLASYCASEPKADGRNEVDGIAFVKYVRAIRESIVRKCVCIGICVHHAYPRTRVRTP